jgi:hypothetical protein
LECWARRHREVEGGYPLAFLTVRQPFARLSLFCTRPGRTTFRTSHCTTVRQPFACLSTCFCVFLITAARSHAVWLHHLWSLTHQQQAVKGENVRMFDVLLGTDGSADFQSAFQWLHARCTFAANGPMHGPEHTCLDAEAMESVFSILQALARLSRCFFPSCFIVIMVGLDCSRTVYHGTWHAGRATS